MNPNIPPRGSSLHALNPEYQERLRQAEKKRSMARKSIDSLESWDSVQYWKYRQEEGEALLEIARLEYAATDPEDLHKTSRDQKRKILQLKEARDSAQRKVERYLARQAALDNEKEGNGCRARAAFLELLISQWTRTKRTGQSAFKEDLKKQYDNSKGGIWSVTLGKYVAQEVKAAHIFPLQLGQAVMSHIFGPEADGEINTARNGLFLPAPIERAFDKHQIAIVPRNETTPTEWKWMVIDRSGLWTTLAEFDKTFADIHDAPLTFPPEATRPRARYFYYHYMMAMVLHGRKNQTGRAGIKEGVADATVPELARVWATQGRYLRDNMIRAFIEELGHSLPEAEDMLVSYIDDTIPASPGAVEECLEDLEICSESEEDIEADLENREKALQEEREMWEKEKEEREDKLERAIDDGAWETTVSEE